MLNQTDLHAQMCSLCTAAGAHQLGKPVFCLTVITITAPSHLLIAEFRSQWCSRRHNKSALHCIASINYQQQQQQHFIFICKVKMNGVNRSRLSTSTAAGWQADALLLSSFWKLLSPSASFTTLHVRERARHMSCTVASGLQPRGLVSLEWGKAASMLIKKPLFRR